MTLPTAQARPLYLQNAKGLRLDLDPNHRLRIHRNDQAEKHIPLHHISRIVCNSTLDISARALMACLQSGIPLSILDTKGSPLGWCLGARRKETTLGQLLNHALDDPIWTNLYPEWLAQQKLVIAVHTLLLCGVPTNAPARRNPRTALCNAHHRKHGQACAAHVNALAMLAQQELAAQLALQSNQPHLLAWYRPGLNLLNDLGQLIGLHAHTDLHHAARLPTPDELPTWAVKHYEKHAHHWQQRIASLLHAFEQFLRTHWL